jgi:hypothetical protein
MPRPHSVRSNKTIPSKSLSKPLCGNLPPPVWQLSPTVMANPLRALKWTPDLGPWIAEVKV